jgi:hypothetical protein
MKIMKITFDIDRYNELLEKEKRLSQQSNSLIFENKDEFIELLSYGARVENQISYERKEEYYSLISQYIEKVVTPQVFQSEFLEMEKEDAKAAKMITNDFKQLAIFSVDLKAVEFSSLIGEISDVSMVAREFGPEEGISDQKFRKSIERTFLQMQDFFEE